MGGVYVPFWTFDSHVSSSWTAERGWYYYETEYYTETVNGRTGSNRARCSACDGSPRSGYRQDFYDDVLVCAGRALPTELVDKLSTFDTKKLVPYRPEFLAGWRAEAYAVDLQPAFGVAQQKIRACRRGAAAATSAATCTAGSGAEPVQEPAFKHVLLPIWIAAYRYNGKAYRFLVNGQTGEVVGVAPWSVWKIALLVVAILAVVGGIIAAVVMNQPSHATPAPTPTPAITTTPTAPPAPVPAPTIEHHPPAPPHAAPSGATSAPHAAPHPSAAPSSHHAH